MKNNESKTSFGKGLIADKGDQCIAFRGEIDSLYAKCVQVCSIAKNENQALFGELTEILKVIGRLMRCEALCECIEFCGVFGYSCEELRKASHNPKKYLGADHFLPDENASLLMAEINCLRSAIRKCERECARTFRVDELHAQSFMLCLNRLSSAVYIMMIKLNREEKA